MCIIFCDLELKEDRLIIIKINSPLTAISDMKSNVQTRTHLFSKHRSHWLSVFIPGSLKDFKLSNGSKDKFTSISRASKSSKNWHHRHEFQPSYAFILSLSDPICPFSLILPVTQFLSADQYLCWPYEHLTWNCLHSNKCVHT